MGKIDHLPYLAAHCCVILDEVDVRAKRDTLRDLVEALEQIWSHCLTLDVLFDNLFQSQLSCHAVNQLVTESF